MSDKNKNSSTDRGMITHILEDLHSKKGKHSKLIANFAVTSRAQVWPFYFAIIGSGMSFETQMTAGPICMELKAEKWRVLQVFVSLEEVHTSAWEGQSKVTRWRSTELVWARGVHCSWYSKFAFVIGYFSTRQKIRLKVINASYYQTSHLILAC